MALADELREGLRAALADLTAEVEKARAWAEGRVPLPNVRSHRLWRQFALDVRLILRDLHQAKGKVAGQCRVLPPLEGS
jgi:hypothetical protein